MNFVKVIDETVFGGEDFRINVKCCKRQMTPEDQAASDAYLKDISEVQSAYFDAQFMFFDFGFRRRRKRSSRQRRQEEAVAVGMFLLYFYLLLTVVAWLCMDSK